MSIIENTFRHSKKLKIDECEVEVKKTTVQITDSEIKQNFDENYGVKLVQDKKIAPIQITDKKYWKINRWLSYNNKKFKIKKISERTTR